MMILGITGGIGSGKTVVLNILKDKYNAYILEADALAHELMRPGHDTYDKIVAVFGSDILLENGEIDRITFGKIVFSDKKKLKELNRIVHPAVKQEILRLIHIQENQKTALFVIEAALLIQDGYKEICDKMCYVYSDIETRIKRLMEGRGYTRDRAVDVINSQENEVFYRNNSDFVIDNSLSIENTKKQIFGYIDKLHL